MKNPYGNVLAGEMVAFLQLLENAGQGVYGYRIAFKSLDAYMLKNNVREKALTEELLSGWLGSLRCQATTKNKRIGSIRQFARYLAALEIPACEYDFLPAQSDYLAYTFTDEEFSAIIEAADSFAVYKNEMTSSTRIFPMALRILYACGLRIGELLELKWEDIDFERNLLIIRRAKNHKQRMVPMSASLAETLKLYCARRREEFPESQFLFESEFRKGKPFLNWTFRQWFLRILEVAGINPQRSRPHERGICPHTLRHYFAYKSFLQMENQGKSLEDAAPFLSAYLGHESLLGTERYLSTDYAVYERSHERMDANIGPLFPEVTFE